MSEGGHVTSRPHEGALMSIRGDIFLHTSGDWERWERFGRDDARGCLPERPKSKVAAKWKSQDRSLEARTEVPCIEDALRCLHKQHGNVHSSAKVRLHVVIARLARARLTPPSRYRVTSVHDRPTCTLASRPPDLSSTRVRSRRQVPMARAAHAARPSTRQEGYARLPALPSLTASPPHRSVPQARHLRRQRRWRETVDQRCGERRWRGSDASCSSASGGGASSSGR